MSTGTVVYRTLVYGSGVYSKVAQASYCAVIVKKVDAKTRSKTGLNELLRVD